ncbi:hypothetical protein MASR2M70_03100 [Bacillota bacterium]
MTKFALIMNVPGESPETYSKAYENAESYNLFVGSGNDEMAAALVRQFAEDGFEAINLCGDFNEEHVKRFVEIGQGKIEVSYADYTPEELRKLEALPSLKEYGFICFEESLENMESLELLSEECNTKVMLVRDLDMACRAAKELVEKGIYFIELCGWFNAERTQAVIEAIDGKVPVGSCGLH